MRPLSPENVELIFNILHNGLGEVDPNLPGRTSTAFTQLALRLLSEAGEEKEETKAAGQYSIVEAVVDFNLEYKPEWYETKSVLYIENLLETKNFVPTPGFGKFSHDLTESCDD
jgi:hypothetical protein